MGVCSALNRPSYHRPVLVIMCRYPARAPRRCLVGLVVGCVVCLVIDYTYYQRVSCGFGVRKLLSAFDLQYDGVNRTWLEQRQRLFSDPHNVKKVIIFAYMRGGSSIIGDTLGHNEDSFYWYEPLDQFYNDYFGYKIYSIPLHITYTLDGIRRIPNTHESQRLAQFISNLYNCRLDALPREVPIHKFMSRSPKTASLDKCGGSSGINACKTLLPDVCSGLGDHKRDTASALNYKCSEQIYKLRNKTVDLRKWGRRNEHKEGRINNSMRFVYHEYCMRRLEMKTGHCVRDYFKEDVCRNQTMQVSKVLRANMETMEYVLQQIPDAYILHYFRDPRAIGMSVQGVPLISFLAQPNRDVLMAEISILCRKMEGDIYIRTQLEKKYPGAFATISYEKLVNEPEKTLDGIYSFIGRAVPKTTMDRLNRAFYNKDAEEFSFSVSRRNASKTSRMWRKNFPKKHLTAANVLCERVLTQLGYPLDIDS